MPVRHTFKVYKTHLSATEIKELGLKGPWFVCRSDGDVREFRTKRSADAYVKDQKSKEERLV